MLVQKNALNSYFYTAVITELGAGKSGCRTWRSGDMIAMQSAFSGRYGADLGISGRPFVVTFTVFRGDHPECGTEAVTRECEQRKLPSQLVCLWTRTISIVLDSTLTSLPPMVQGESDIPGGVGGTLQASESQGCPNVILPLRLALTRPLGTVSTTTCFCFLEANDLVEHQC